MTKITDLFVYGAFSEDGHHHRLIDAYVTKSRPAEAVGSVYRLEVGYPVFVAQGEDRVQGQLLTIEGPDFLGQLLDDLHGISLVRPEESLCDRLEGEFWLIGEQVSAPGVIYALRRERIPEGATLIKNGDWQLSLAQRPPLPAVMTDRQKNYVKRLAASTGREIVPIDLDLYRELIKLALVVDKGRRLALTALGREVLRYI